MNDVVRNDPLVDQGLWLGGAVILVCLVLGSLLAASAWLTSGLVTGRWAALTSDRASDFVAALVSGRSPADAWRLAAGGPSPPSAAIVASAAAAALLGTWVALRVRTSLPHRRRDAAQWATRQDEQPVVTTADPNRRPNRLVAGRSCVTGRYLAGHDCVSAVVFGPNGSGKTAGLIVPNAVDWRGSVVMTTAKSQDLGPVVAARRDLGPMWVIAPGGAPGFETATWSPVDYATDADAADRMAGWLVDSSGMTGDPRSRPWNAQARKYLKGLLLAAHLSGRGIDGFIEWAYDGELAAGHVGQILGEHGHVEVLREYRSTWRIHEEGKGSVMFTAFGLADTYNRPGVLRSARGSDFTAEELVATPSATLLLVTPQSEVERFTPYFTALISSIVHAAEQGAAQTGGPITPRLLLALDEAGNVFRYPRLPHLLTTARGNGVQLLLAYHDIAQIEHLFGGRDVARTILSNAKMRLLLPGVGDVDTLRYFSDLLGQTKTAVTSRQTGTDGRRSRSESDQHEPLAPLHVLQQQPAGEAVMVYENLPPIRLRLRYWFKDRRLRRLGHVTTEATS